MIYDVVNDVEILKYLGYVLYKSDERWFSGNYDAQD